MDITILRWGVAIIHQDEKVWKDCLVACQITSIHLSKYQLSEWDTNIEGKGLKDSGRLRNLENFQ